MVEKLFDEYTKKKSRIVSVNGSYLQSVSYLGYMGHKFNFFTLVHTMYVFWRGSNHKERSSSNSNSPGEPCIKNINFIWKFYLPVVSSVTGTFLRFCKVSSRLFFLISTVTSLRFCFITLRWQNGISSLVKAQASYLDGTLKYRKIKLEVFE